MIFYESDMNILFTYSIKIIYENLYGGHLLRLYEGHLSKAKVTRSATWNLLHMKNEFKYFDSLSVIILILILIVLYNTYVLYQYWVFVLSVHMILWLWFYLWPCHWEYKWHYVTWANFAFCIYAILFAPMINYAFDILHYYEFMSSCCNMSFYEIYNIQ